MGAIMATTPSFEDQLNLREQIARIDKTQAEIAKMTAGVAKIKIDTRFAPAQVGFAGLAAGATIVGAVVAFIQIFIR